MRLILLRNIERLGVVGEVVNVADGYGRNWLLPQQYAVEATPENIRQLDHRKRKLLAMEKETLQKFQAMGAEVAKQSITIRARANPDDHLFGSVAARDIVDAFHAEGLELEARMILLEEPIKELGCYTVKVRLHPEVEVSVKIWVVGESMSSQEIPEDVVPDEIASDLDSEEKAAAPAGTETEEKE